MQCYKELAQWGAQDMLQKEYGPYYIPNESQYDVTLEFVEFHRWSWCVVKVRLNKKKEKIA